MGKILIVNTGPTEYERQGQYPLMDKIGLDAPMDKWAQAALSRLLEYQLSAVYYLPVPEALETAEIIAVGYKLVPKILPGFENTSEISWKGLSPEEACVFDCPLGERESTAVDIKFPFNDDLKQLRGKISAALDEIAAGYKKETVAVVSHRALSVIMVLHFLHMDNCHYNQIAQENGAVNL
ncbi:MAG: histidine phosphatase family protein, partial [Chloroflexi bacterium]|nr:histidine phosphatase family protein [Chloroflexota bacterium]